jgi:hypothetical protein
MADERGRGDGDETPDETPAGAPSCGHGPTATAARSRPPMPARSGSRGSRTIRRPPTRRPLLRNHPISRRSRRPISPLTGTSDHNALEALAEALQALAAKLTDAQGAAGARCRHFFTGLGGPEFRSGRVGARTRGAFAPCHRSRPNSNPCRSGRLPLCRGFSNRDSARCASRNDGRARKRGWNDGKLGMDSSKISSPGQPSGLPDTTAAPQPTLLSGLKCPAK